MARTNSGKRTSSVDAACKDIGDWLTFDDVTLLELENDRRYRRKKPKLDSENIESSATSLSHSSSESVAIRKCSHSDSSGACPGIAPVSPPLVNDVFNPTEMHDHTTRKQLTPTNHSVAVSDNLCQLSSFQDTLDAHRIVNSCDANQTTGDNVTFCKSIDYENSVENLNWICTAAKKPSSKERYSIGTESVDDISKIRSKDLSHRTKCAGYRNLGLRKVPHHSSMTVGAESLFAASSPLSIECFKEEINSYLRKLKRDDLQPVLDGTYYLPVAEDEVEKYFSQKPKPELCSSSSGQTKAHVKTRSQTSPQLNPLPPLNPEPTADSCTNHVHADIEMRVKIVYKMHRHRLDEIVSNKETAEQRQLDKFFQAVGIMKTRESSVICNIGFADFSCLGAFWRDYTNGALQKALKNYFLTEMFKHALPGEDLDIFVSVEASAFRAGQLKLLNFMKKKAAKETTNS